MVRVAAGWVLLLLLCMAPLPLAAASQCPDLPPCRGCGCRGGTGYRHTPTQRCVGFRELDKLCGTPPLAEQCVFENHPNTGLNRECTLPHGRRRVGS